MVGLRSLQWQSFNQLQGFRVEVEDMPVQVLGGIDEPRSGKSTFLPFRAEV